jgi:hypothetical protein
LGGSLISENFWKSSRLFRFLRYVGGANPAIAQYGLGDLKKTKKNQLTVPLPGQQLALMDAESTAGGSTIKTKKIFVESFDCGRKYLL